MSDFEWARAAVAFWLGRLIKQCADDFEAESQRFARMAASVRGWIT